MEYKNINYYEKPGKYYLNYSPEENRVEEKDNKKYYTKSHHSSDLTSFSYTPTEAFSQTSENSYNHNDTISHQNSIGENYTLNYFAEVITYFKQTEPAKFYEYKDSKNFIPKRKKEKIQKADNQNNNNMICNNNNNTEENKIVPVYYIPVDTNTYNNIINGNIIYYVYNNFFFNSPMNNTQTENDLNKNENNKDNKTPEKEVKKNKKFKEEEKIEIKKKDDIEIIKVEKKREKNINKIEGNYIIKKRQKKNNNKSPIPKNEDKEIEYYESNKYRNKKKDFHMYDDQFESKTYSNNYKGKFRQYDNFNKFNGNIGGRKKNYFGENKFYKRKYHQPMYY